MKKISAETHKIRHITEIEMETGGQEMCQIDSQQSLVEQILLTLKSAVTPVNT